MTKLIEGMRYLEWQKRNQQGFDNLTKIQKKEARNQGYYNRGWDKVLNSWNIIKINNVVTLFEYKLSKGDILGAIGQSIAEANQAKNFVLKSIDALDKNQELLDQLAEAKLAIYQTL